MARISINNGRTYIYSGEIHGKPGAPNTWDISSPGYNDDAEHVLALWPEIVHRMDDDVREAVHISGDRMCELELLRAYLDRCTSEIGDLVIG